VNILTQYFVKQKEILSQKTPINAISGVISQYESKLRSISNSMDGRDSGMSTLKSSLINAANNLQPIGAMLTAAASAIDSTSSIYREAEIRNYNSIENKDKVLPGIKISDYDSVFHFSENGVTLDVLKQSWENSVDFKFLTWESDIPTNHKKIDRTEMPYNQYAYEKETGQMIFYGMAPDLAQKKGTILEASAGGYNEWSLIEFDASKKGEWAEGNFNIKAGTAEIHANLSAGLYVFDQNGTKKLAPSVGAEIGASATVLAITASGRLGNDLYGGYGDVDVNIGKLEAIGTARASVFNEDGKLDIQAKIGASAEAYAFEAKGRAGATLLGADVGVTGSFNVGIGAHAEASFVKGVVKVDVGATLGFGASIGFEIDAGGMVNATYGAAKSVFNFLTRWF
jgi:hypothetical protein